MSLLLLLSPRGQVAALRGGASAATVGGSTYVRDWEKFVMPLEAVVLDGRTRAIVVDSRTEAIVLTTSDAEVGGAGL